MGHGAESITTAQKHSKFIEKLATTFKGTVRQKNFHLYNALSKAYPIHA
jgi:hypothetical protein